MPPRINSEGCYTDENTQLPDGSLRPHTDAELAATAAHESAHGITSTLPADADTAEVDAVDPEDDA